MLNQEKTGRFIAETRKRTGFTQRELADRLGVSDKTVSKWETGHGMPDVSVIPALCEALSVSANELLAGERLDSTENFSRKAEENIMELMKEKKKMNTGWRWTLGGLLLGVVLLFLFSVSMHGLTDFYYTVVDYIDLPSAFCVWGIGLIMLALSGRLRAFFKGFALCFRKEAPDETLLGAVAMEKWRAAEAFDTAIFANFLAGGFGFVTSLIYVLHRLDDPARIGPNMAVALITLFYGVLFNLILLPIRERLQG